MYPVVMERVLDAMFCPASSRKRCKRDTRHVQDLPDELMLNILFYLPLEDLTTCFYVCKDWCRVLYWEGTEFHKKMLREDVIKDELKLQRYYTSALDWIRLYSTAPFTGNLLTNSNFEQHTRHWSVVSGPWKHGQLGTNERFNIDTDLDLDIELREEVGQQFVISDLPFSRCQKIELLRIPHITEIMRTFDLYLTWSCWTKSRGEFQEFISFISDGVLDTTSLDIFPTDQSSKMLCYAELRGASIWDLKTSEVRIEEDDLDNIYYTEHGLSGAMILQPTLQIKLKKKERLVKLKSSSEINC